MTSTGRASGAASAVREGVDPRYGVAFLDWLSCCSAGASERAARCAQAVADGVSDRVRAAAIAGHVLDFDDTYVPGLAHLSAPTAPVALILGAELGATIGDVLRAYAEGFEAMGALARSSHPALYQRGWHPTAVCGAVGAAVTAAVLLRQARDQAHVDAPLTVSVHPRARQAAPYDDVQDALAAKFSIPYAVAYTLLYGPPLAPSCFRAVDAQARQLAEKRISVRLDVSLPE